MKPDSVPQDLSHYLIARLAACHASTRLVFVFDPPGRLALGDHLVAAGRTWSVVRYDGNDLALRARLVRLANPPDPVLIWVIGRPDPGGPPPGTLRLTSLVDLLVRADDWFDLSLVGVLRDLVPGETWPVEAVEQFASILSADLPAVVDGHHHLRRYLEPGTALDVHAMRLLALHVVQPTIPLPDLIFRRDTPAQALDRYLHLAWRAAWTAEGRELLRQHARLSPQVALGDLVTWFDVVPQQLATYVYVRRFLAAARVPNIANQLRGLGLLGFDPEPLEPWVDRVLAFWERDAAWRQQIIVDVEATLSPGDVRRIVALLRGAGTDGLWRAVTTAETPAFLAASLSELLYATAAHDLDAVISQWLAHRPAIADSLPATPHSALAQALAGFLEETAGVQNKLARGFTAGADLAGIIDWYVDGGFFDMEFACARASGHVRSVPDPALVARLHDHLRDLRRRVRDFLETADQALAQGIAASWKQVPDHPRLATHVVSDLIKQRRVQPTAESSIFVVIFDGMRWDSWQRVIKPRLLQIFEMKEPEKAYLSLLPSWTFVARTGILAGQPPQHWAPGRDGGITTNARVLAAKLFDIPPPETERRLRFVSRMEIDKTYLQLDPKERFPWNVVIFNVSDDNLHQERGSLLNLNDKITVLLEEIVRTLDSLVGPQDTVVLTSDHGFMELDEADGVVIQEDARGQRVMAAQDDPVRFRYLVGMEHPAGFVVRHPGLRESPFTVAVGRRWFKRVDGRPADRYAHGGLSLAEMVVPGVVLRRIVHRRIEVGLDEPPVQLEALEGEAFACDVMLVNRGNQPARYRLEVKANTDAGSQVFEGELSPGQRHAVRPTVQPVYRVGGDGTAFVTLALSYDDLHGKRQQRRHEIKVIVKARSDVVEMQFAGLDELDGLIHHDEP